MTDHDIECLDKTIEQLAGRLERAEMRIHDGQTATWQLESKVRELEIKIASLQRQQH